MNLNESAMSVKRMAAVLRDDDPWLYVEEQPFSILEGETVYAHRVDHAPGHDLAPENLLERAIDKKPRLASVPNEVTASEHRRRLTIRQLRENIQLADALARQLLISPSPATARELARGCAVACFLLRQLGSRLNDAGAA